MDDIPFVTLLGKRGSAPAAMDLVSRRNMLGTLVKTLSTGMGRKKFQEKCI
jgi:hypothetical protein